MPGDLTGKDRNKGREKGSRTNWKRVSKQYVKMGSGGTLDPLADGVLSELHNALALNFQHLPLGWIWTVVGVGSGTKDLAQFLHCTKVRIIFVYKFWLPIWPPDLPDDWPIRMRDGFL